MVMRLDIDFPTPLTIRQRTDLYVALSGLAKAERMWLVQGGFGAIVMGEAMSTKRVREALDEFQLPVEAIYSSLNEDEDALVDEVPEAAGTATERLKPIGR